MPACRGLLSVGLVLSQCHHPSEKLLAPAELWACTPRLGAEGAGGQHFPRDEPFPPIPPDLSPTRGREMAPSPLRHQLV